VPPGEPQSDIFSPSPPLSSAALASAHRVSTWEGSSSRHYLFYFWDGTRPKGYYFYDTDGVFPDDPNDDGNNLGNDPVSSSEVGLWCRVANITNQQRLYKIILKIFNRNNGACVYNCDDSYSVSTSVDGFSIEEHVQVIKFNHPLSLHQFPPGRYSLRLYLENESLIQDSLTTYFNLVKGANQPPESPTITSGPSEGYVDVSYKFSVYALDPDSDNVMCRFS